MDADRLAEFVSERLGRRVVAVEPIAAGMGARRFHRLRFVSGEPSTLVARLEPDASSTDARVADPDPKRLPAAPTWLPEPPLEPLRSVLEAAGLPVPQSAGHFPALGLELLEDVGSTNLLHAPSGDRTALYAEACALVPRLQRLEAPPDQVPAFARRYDTALVDTKRWKWLHWAIPGLLHRAATPVEVRETTRLFAAIAEELEAAPRRLAHRDFKAENLHLRSPAAGGRPHLVMIDVQGAFLAPPEYDLVCLLYDLQADVSEADARRWFEQTRPQLPDAPPAETAQRRFDALAVTRLCKDVAHVVHAGVARGDRRRWHEIPRGLALLERAASRLESGLPGIETLISVIHALTTADAAADIAAEGMAR